MKIDYIMYEIRSPFYIDVDERLLYIAVYTCGLY